MICNNCGGDMVGDGYTMVIHCEHAEGYESYEPDAGPIDCHGMRILSIDAWAGCAPGEGDWNSWNVAGHIPVSEFEALKTPKDYAVWFYKNGYITTSDMRRITVEDDGYNKTICEKKTGMPVFCIEYGCHY